MTVSNNSNGASNQRMPGRNAPNSAQERPQSSRAVGYQPEHERPPARQQRDGPAAQPNTMANPSNPTSSNPFTNHTGRAVVNNMGFRNQGSHPAYSQPTHLPPGFQHHDQYLPPNFSPQHHYYPHPNYPLRAHVPSQHHYNMAPAVPPQPHPGGQPMATPYHPQTQPENMMPNSHIPQEQGNRRDTMPQPHHQFQPSNPPLYFVNPQHQLQAPPQHQPQNSIPAHQHANPRSSADLVRDMVRMIQSQVQQQQQAASSTPATQPIQGPISGTSENSSGGKQQPILFMPTSQPIQRPIPGTSENCPQGEQPISSTLISQPIQRPISTTRENGLREEQQPQPSRVQKPITPIIISASARSKGNLPANPTPNQSQPQYQSASARSNEEPSTQSTQNPNQPQHESALTGANGKLPTSSTQNPFQPQLQSQHQPLSASPFPPPDNSNTAPHLPPTTLTQTQIFTSLDHPPRPGPAQKREYPPDALWEFIVYDKEGESDDNGEDGEKERRVLDIWSLSARERREGEKFVGEGAWESFWKYKQEREKKEKEERNRRKERERKRRIRRALRAVRERQRVMSGAVGGNEDQVEKERAEYERGDRERKERERSERETEGKMVNVIRRPDELQKHKEREKGFERERAEREKKDRERRQQKDVEWGREKWEREVLERREREIEEFERGMSAEGWGDWVGDDLTV